MPWNQRRGFLHPIVIRPAAALGRHPGDDLVGVHDVAGLAVDTVGRIQVYLLAVGHVCGLHHLVHIGWAEMLAGISELLHATGIADIGVMNDQMRRLVFFMLRAGMIKISQLVEGELAVSTGLAQHVRPLAAIFGKLVEVLQSTMSGMGGVDLMQAASSGYLL